MSLILECGLHREVHDMSVYCYYSLCQTTDLVAHAMELLSIMLSGMSVASYGTLGGLFAPQRHHSLYL